MLWFRFDFAESLPKPFVIQELCEPWPVKVFPCFRALFVFCFHIHKFSGSPMARRTNKTAKRKRSGQQSRTGIQGHTVKHRRSPFWKRTPKPIYAVLGVAALAVTLLEGYPWLSIQEGSLTDPGNPFSEMFKVVNGGYVPVTNLDAVCLLGGEQPGRVYISPGAYKIIQTGFANYLEHDKAATIPCFGSLGIEDSNISGGATMEVTISYAFWHLNWNPLRRSQTFRFTSVRGTDGSQHWQFISWNVVGRGGGQ